MKPPCILLVEDNEANVHLVRFLLEHAGARVTRVANGVECLAAIAQELPDLVLLDLQMPVMDGYETAQRLQADAATRHLPLIASSAYAQPTDEARARAVGFRDYIAKPFDPGTFAARVLRHVRPAEVSEID